MCSIHTTTYQDDYSHPVVRGAQAATATIEEERIPERCEPVCAPVKHDDEPMETECADKHEWTGIGPMGALIKPQLIPDDDSYGAKPAKQAHMIFCPCMSCGPCAGATCDPCMFCNPCITDPNQIGDHVSPAKPSKPCVTYGELYYNNNSTNKCDPSHFKTTYREDYTHGSGEPSYTRILKIKHFNGLDEDKHPQLNDIEKLDGKGGGGGHGQGKQKVSDIPQGGPFDANKNDKDAKPDKKQTQNFGVMSKDTVSEYFATICKVGDAIFRHKIHNHEKCKNGRYCRHSIKFPK